MLKKILLASLIALGGCGLITGTESVDPKKLEQAIIAHQQVISAITDYISKLQEQGYLPKPERLAQPKEKK